MCSSNNSRLSDKLFGDRPANTLFMQLQRNLLAVISLVIALSALAYNTYRNELTEANRNTRSAGFVMLQELSQLQLISDYAHYEQDTSKGNPIDGWGRLLYIRDMSYLVSGEVAAGADLLAQVWGREWNTLREDETSNRRVTEAIQAVRDQVRYTIESLD